MHTLVAHLGDTGPVHSDVPVPPLGADDIRVSVAATAVNPVDIWFASGEAHAPLALPPTVGLGWDIAGTVVEVGASVTTLSVGDVVAALHDDVTAAVRAHSELATVPATAAALVPDGLTTEAAASTPLNTLTAAQALDLLGAPNGRTLLVTGAAGAVGGYAVALAARAGWQVTGLARSTDEAFVRDAGATAVVTEVPGPEYDAVLDAAALQEGAIGAVRDGGAFVGVLPPAPVPTERDIDVSAVSVHADGTRLAELLQLSRDDVLAVRVAGTVPLADAATAYDKLASGGQRGRWLLIP